MHDQPDIISLSDKEISDVYDPIDEYFISKGGSPLYAEKEYMVFLRSRGLNINEDTLNYSWTPNPSIFPSLR